MNRSRIRVALGATTATGVALAANAFGMAPASAATVKVNFDGGTPGAPCAFADTTALRDKYAGIGIKFRGSDADDGGAILDTCSSFGVDPHSGLRFLAFNENSTLRDGGTPAGPERIRFHRKQKTVKIWVSQGGSPGDAQFSLVAKRKGHRVDRATLSTNTSDWEVLKVHARRGIRSVVLKGVDPTGTWVADDLVVRR